MIKEIIAAKAHIAEKGTKMKRFDAAAARMNANPRFQPSVNGRSVSERFKVRMKAFVQMRNRDEASSGVAYEYSEAEILLEEIKSQMEAVEALQHTEKEKESEQRRRKDEAAKRVLSSANGILDVEDDQIINTPRGPKRQRTNGPTFEFNNGLEAFGASIEKSEGARMSLEQRRLEFEERVHNDMILERERDRADRRLAEERRESREMERMKVFMEFSMNAIISAVKEATKKD